jgi:hypothetical protein
MQHSFSLFQGMFLIALMQLTILIADCYLAICKWCNPNYNMMKIKIVGCNTTQASWPTNDPPQRLLGIIFLYPLGKAFLALSIDPVFCHRFKTLLIHFTLPLIAHVLLTIFDYLSGRVVVRVIPGAHAALVIFSIFLEAAYIFFGAVWPAAGAAA